MCPCYRPPTDSQRLVLGGQGHDLLHPHYYPDSLSGLAGTYLLKNLFFWPAKEYSFNDSSAVGQKSRKSID